MVGVGVSCMERDHTAEQWRQDWRSHTGIGMDGRGDGRGICSDGRIGVMDDSVYANVSELELALRLMPVFVLLKGSHP